MTLQIYSEQYNNISSRHSTSRLIVKTCESTAYINSPGELQFLMILLADVLRKLTEATFANLSQIMTRGGGARLGERGNVRTDAPRRMRRMRRRDGEGEAKEAIGGI